MLTQDRLKQVLSYDPVTGEFVWIVSMRPRGRIGAVAGYTDARGYVLISINGRSYFAQRLVWLLMTGEWPSADVDHRDCDKSNNRWENLRAATRTQNNANCGRRSSNTSGFKGVSWSASRRKWIAYIKFAGKTRNLGYFDEPEKAHAAYVAKATELFGDFARSA